MVSGFDLCSPRPSQFHRRQTMGFKPWGSLLNLVKKSCTKSICTSSTTYSTKNQQKTNSTILAPYYLWWRMYRILQIGWSQNINMKLVLNNLRKCLLWYFYSLGNVWWFEENTFQNIHIQIYICLHFKTLDIIDTFLDNVLVSPFNIIWWTLV